MAAAAEDVAMLMNALALIAKGLTNILLLWRFHFTSAASAGERQLDTHDVMNY
jgi:O-antigen/teichoic acid export membrane protein